MKQENRIQQFGKNGDVIAIQCLSIKGLFSAQLRTDSFDADTTFMTVRNNEIVSSFTAKVICALGVLLTSFCTFADTWTDPYTGHMWDYYINGLGYAEIISVSPPTGAVTIPAMLGGKPVVSVGFWDNCKGVTSVTIPDGVRNI